MYSPTAWAPKTRAGDHRSAQPSVHQLNMADMDEHERKIVNEFNHYLEKSKQLFNGLRYG